MIIMHYPYLIIVEMENENRTSKDVLKPLTNDEICAECPSAEDVYKNCDQKIVDYVEDEKNENGWKVSLKEYFHEEIKLGLIKVCDEKANTFVISDDRHLHEEHLRKRFFHAFDMYGKMLDAKENVSDIAYRVRWELNPSGPRVYAGNQKYWYLDYSFEEFLEHAMGRKERGYNVTYQLLAVYDYHC